MTYHFPSPDSVLASTRTWAISHDGIPSGTAFLIFLALCAATIVAYRRFAPGAPLGRKWTMAALRICACAILCALLTRPVLRLTEYELVKQSFAVLVDASRSMDSVDRRETPADINRAAIATGLISPDSPLNASIPGALSGQMQPMSRMDLVNGIADNRQLDLWTRLAGHANLRFHRFGATLQSLPQPEAREPGTNRTAGIIPPKVTPDASVTAIGEALRDVLVNSAGQRLGGVLLVTDGGNNHGSSPLEAALIAREQNVPLFIYGVGVTAPPDLEVLEVSTRNLAFVGERLEVRAKIRSVGLEEEHTVATLMADGEPVATAESRIGGDREHELVFHYVPSKAGEARLDVSVPLRDAEVGRDNNTSSTVVRITDEKFKVLLIEQEPRWDFRYLLDYLQRDPSLVVRCVMIDGEPGLERLPESPFLPALPSSRPEFFEFQVLILGDVNPVDLGIERMEILADWVEAGGGLIFLAGPDSNPASYHGTPLEPLLPIVADPSRPRQWSSLRESEPFALELTSAGRRSPYLRMDADPEENRRIWESFPGVRWTAPVSRVKPGAEVLLVDPRPQSAGRYGLLPVFAMQSHGSGKCVYFGTDETYRWRSRTGETYYSLLWGQIMQTLALQLLDGASSLTQLRTDRKQYNVGETVVIAGNAYTGNYEPLISPFLEGTLSRIGAAVSTAVESHPLQLTATGRNTFRGEFIPRAPGRYRFQTAHDPQGVLAFDVVENDPENTTVGLDDRLLLEMARLAGGRFLREENLHELPSWIADRSSRVATYRNVDLYSSGWVLAALILFLAGEWLLRRLTRLK